MVGEWKTIPASKFCSSVRDGTHASPKPVPNGELLITSRHIIGGRVDLSEAYRISREDFDETNRRSKVDKWDVLISMIGTVGEPCLIREDPTFAIKNIGLFKSRSELDGKWLYYYLKSPAAQELVRAGSRGSTQQYIPLGALRELPVTYPEDRGDMRRIVETLSSFDDKIEQNRRTSRKLEELARAVFKAWFVDFEPVKAKAAGATSFPGMPPETFATLPTRLVDSPLGPVPEGWGVKALSDAFEVNPSRRLAKGADATYLDMKNMPTDGHAPDTWERRPHGSGMKFINGDTLVARITPCLENGKTAFVDFLGEGEVAWGSTEYIVLRPRPPLPPLFAYCLARTETFRDFAIQNMSGTSGRQRVSASALEHYHVTVPDSLTARSFGQVVEPPFACIRACKNESARLATLRDYLLPRLLSGRVRVGKLLPTVAV